MRRVSLKYLLLASILMSAASVVIPATGLLPTSDLFVLDGWLALICVGLAIYGIVLYRWRGTWLLLPILFALIWPVVLFRSACNVDVNICG